MENLPKEILDRHYKFVKYYEDNLKELKTNLNAVELYTVDSKQGKEAFRKAKLHLEKVKPLKKHIPLDPNNLPFRAQKATKTREPRMKKEEFEKDFPPQRRKSTPSLANLDHKDTKTLRSSSSLRDFVVNDFLAADLRRSTLISGSFGFKSAIRNPQSKINHKPSLLAYNDIASDVPLQLPRPVI